MKQSFRILLVDRQASRRLLTSILSKGNKVVFAKDDRDAFYCIKKNLMDSASFPNLRIELIMVRFSLLLEYPTIVSHFRAVGFKGFLFVLLSSPDELKEAPLHCICANGIICCNPLESTGTDSL